MARTVEDVIMFDNIFSECNYSRQEIELNGSRIGYPVNYWEGLDVKASSKCCLVHTVPYIRVLVVHTTSWYRVMTM